jgi:hypothetical protein
LHLQPHKKIGSGGPIKQGEGGLPLQESAKNERLSQPVEMEKRIRQDSPFDSSSETESSSGDGIEIGGAHRHSTRRRSSRIRRRRRRKESSSSSSSPSIDVAVSKPVYKLQRASSGRSQSLPIISYAPIATLKRLPVDSTIYDRRQSFRKLKFRVHVDFLLQCGLAARLFSNSNIEWLSLTAKLFLKAQQQQRIARKGEEKVQILSISPTIVIFLPLPDPSSFSYLLHYLYHGSIEVLINGMDTGALKWQGVIANTDFLDLDVRIKQQLGKWWRENAAGQEMKTNGSSK